MKTMDGTGSAYLPVGGTGKGAAEGEALFDFPDNQCHSNGLKSLGVFIEQNNNEEKTDVGGFDAPIFWSDKEGTLLDDISPWGEWSDSKPSVDSSDSTVYTLTVLNSSEQWTKSNEKPKKADNLDLESFLNILPEAESDSSNYFYPEYTAFVDPKDLPSSPSTNNNDWKANNNNNNVNESLLRSALQGKSGFQRYGSSCKKLSRGCASQYPDTSITQYPVENGNTTHIDEILGFTSSDNYGEDFEKIKKIAIEVADCAKYSMPVCNDMYSLSPSDPMIPPSIHPGTSPSNKCFGKKFSKKPMSHSGAKTSSGSARKERSLHYCSICAKGFKDKYSVNVHVRTHTGEKPFTCNLCGKSFRQKAHLAKHYQTHLAQSQKQLGNGNSSASRQRPKVSPMDGQHR